MLHNSLLGLAVIGLIGWFGSPDSCGQSRPDADVAERHIACTTSRVKGSPDPPLPYTTEPWLPELPLKHAVFAAAEPGRTSLLVALHQTSGPKPSRLVRIPETTTATQELNTILEVPSRVIYSFTFHPNYVENGFIYVGSNGPLEQDERTDRVSRYTVDGSGRIDPNSEQVILEWRSMGHDGLAMVFGHDGMFYVTSGDGTSDSDAWLSAQDVTNLCGSVMRIDVDHPTPERPYSIPPDNPFVNMPQARGELWAIGLRNPWRMCVDKKSGQIWVGNNGQDLWESVHLIRRGENYGWSVYEGGHPFYSNRPLGPAPYVAPTLEHHHQEARSLTGGEVYYGDRHPGLDGVYVYGDYHTGKIWGARHDGIRVTWQQELADTTLAIVGFAVTHQGELLVVDYQQGLHRLIPKPVDPSGASFPRKLSETGLFLSVKDHRMQEGVFPYQVNSPAWTDGALAERFVALPTNEPIVFQETGHWDLPNGTVILQSLYFPDGDKGKQWLETRMLHREGNEWTGYAYQWNTRQDDAILVDARGEDVNQLPGNGEAIEWRIPSRSECMSCHARAAGYVLGLSQSQMNRDCDVNGNPENQIDTWHRLGLLRAGSHKPLQEMTRLTDPYDVTQPISERARSYLHTNCSVCHMLTGGGNSRMELGIQVPAEKMAVIDAQPQHDTFGIENARIVSPGDPDHSVLYHRLTRRGRGQMPPLVTRSVDTEAAELIRAWIAAMPPVRKFVRAWQLEDLRHELNQVKGEPSPDQGKAVYRDAGCLQCHRMAGEGGGIGPDLTNLSERRNRSEVLESIVQPSQVIAPEFALTIIHTFDGRMWEGRVAHEDDQRLLLRQTSSFATPVELQKSDIEARVLAPHSMMPAGLLNSWEPSQIADLIAYLLQPKANALPAGQK